MVRTSSSPGFAKVGDSTEQWVLRHLPSLLTELSVVEPAASHLAAASMTHVAGEC